MGAKKRVKGMRLDDRVVAALPFKKKQYVVWDLTTEGCGVRVSKTMRSCVISVRLGPEERTFKTIGTVTPGTTYEYLRELATKELAKLRRSRVPMNLPPGESTLSQALDNYFAARADRSESYIEDFRLIMERNFAEQLNQPLVLLTTTEILRLNKIRIEQLDKDDPKHRPPNGFYSWQGTLRCLRAIVSWYAASKGRANPWPDRRVLPIKNPPARVLPVELQCASGRRKLVEGLRADNDLPARACLFLAFTGFRRGEGTRLSPTHLLTDSVVQFKSKTRTLRVPLCRQAAELINRNSDTTLLRATVDQLWKPLNRIFGVRITSRGKRSRVTPHDLRRLFKTVGVELGVDPTILNILVGHAIKGVDASYIAKLRLVVLKEAAQRIADEIENPRIVPGEDDLLIVEDTPFCKQDGASRPAAIAPALSVKIQKPEIYLRASPPSKTGARQPTRFCHYLSREDLHRLVWTAPVSELAQRFGITGAGLAKVCRRASIPVPPRGYWARIESGVHVQPEPLPPAPRGLPQPIRIRGMNKAASSELALAA